MQRVSANFTNDATGSGPAVKSIIIDAPKWVVVLGIGILIITTAILSYSLYYKLFPDYSQRITVQERSEKMERDFKVWMQARRKSLKMPTEVVGGRSGSSVGLVQNEREVGGERVGPDRRAENGYKDSRSQQPEAMEEMDGRYSRGSRGEPLLEGRGYGRPSSNAGGRYGINKVG